jgi:hypothetical protein
LSQNRLKNGTLYLRSDLPLLPGGYTSTPVDGNKTMGYSIRDHRAKGKTFELRSNGFRGDYTGRETFSSKLGYFDSEDEAIVAAEKHFISREKKWKKMKKEIEDTIKAMEDKEKLDLKMLKKFGGKVDQFGGTGEIINWPEKFREWYIKTYPGEADYVKSVFKKYG